VGKRGKKLLQKRLTSGKERVKSRDTRITFERQGDWSRNAEFNLRRKRESNWTNLKLQHLEKNLNADRTSLIRSKKWGGTAAITELLSGEGSKKDAPRFLDARPSMNVCLGKLHQVFLTFEGTMRHRGRSKKEELR